MIMPQASTYVRIPDDAAFRGETGPLPAGVRRVTPDALGAIRLMDGPIARNAEGKVQVAAFDFDGTCIQGNSPVMLVRYLHFQIDGMAVIDDQMDVEDKVPVLNSFSELNGILNPDFCNIFHFDMQKG